MEIYALHGRYQVLTLKGAWFGLSYLYRRLRGLPSSDAYRKFEQARAEAEDVWRQMLPEQ